MGIFLTINGKVTFYIAMQRSLDGHLTPQKREFFNCVIKWFLQMNGLSVTKFMADPVADFAHYGVRLTVSRPSRRHRAIAIHRRGGRGIGQIIPWIDSQDRR